MNWCRPSPPPPLSNLVSVMFNEYPTCVDMSHTTLSFVNIDWNTWLWKDDVHFYCSEFEQYLVPEDFVLSDVWAKADFVDHFNCTQFNFAAQHLRSCSVLSRVNIDMHWKTFSVWKSVVIFCRRHVELPAFWPEYTIIRKCTEAFKHSMHLIIFLSLSYMWDVCESKKNNIVWQNYERQ